MTLAAECAYCFGLQPSKIACPLTVLALLPPLLFCREALAAAQSEQAARAASKPETAAGEEEVEIEYVSAPLELDFLEAAAGGGDTEMGEAAGVGAAAGGRGLEQAGMAADEEAGGQQQQPSATADLQRILQRFGNVEELLGTAPAAGGEGEAGAGGADGGEEGAAPKGDGGDSGEDGEGEDDEGKALSKKKRKIANQLKIAELKQAS